MTKDNLQTMCLFRTANKCERESLTVALMLTSITDPLIRQSNTFISWHIRFYSAQTVYGPRQFICICGLMHCKWPCACTIMSPMTRIPSHASTHLRGLLCLISRSTTTHLVVPRLRLLQKPVRVNIRSGEVFWFQPFIWVHILIIQDLPHLS